VYESNISPWSGVTTKNLNSYRRQLNLGNVLRQNGKITEAIGHYRKAFAIHPSYSKASNNLGMLLKSRGDTEQ